MTETWVAIRENCILKEDYDSCLESWNSMPNVSNTVWNVFDDDKFRMRMLDSLKNVLEESEIEKFVVLPELILDVINDPSVHSMTILDMNNKAEKYLPLQCGQRLQQLLRLIASKWIKADYLTKIILSFAREPDCPRKMMNMSHFFGIIFTAGEKFIETEEFIKFLLGKVDAALRVLALKYANGGQTSSQIHPLTLGSFIERSLVRYQAVGSSYEVNPFVTFMESLLDLCNVNFKIQRLIASILIQLAPVAHEKILTLWLRVTHTARIPSIVPFYPLTVFMANSSYRKTLLLTIPFTTVPNKSSTFWKNWADYVTSNVNFAPMVWKKFTEHFWSVASKNSNGEIIISPVFAFAALSSRIKTCLAEIPMEQLTPGQNTLEAMSRGIGSGETTALHIVWALAYIVFDLCRLHQIKLFGTTDSAGPLRNAQAEKSKLYKKLLRLYNNQPKVPTTEAETLECSCQEDDEKSESSADVLSEIDYTEGHEEYDPGIDDRVKRLRAAGLNPTSMLDVYLILTGDTTGTESETEVLKQLAILNIPILITAGSSIDVSQVEFIAIYLLEWGEDDEMDDLVVVSLSELGTSYPDTVAMALENLIFGKKHSVGEKVRILKVAERALSYCGTRRCTNCCCALQKKQAVYKFINRLEPKYFTKYLNRPSLPQCITCPLATDEDVEPEVVSEEVDMNTASDSPRQPVTRRWGTTRSVEQPIPSVKMLHAAIWPIFRNHLTTESEAFLNQCVVQDGIQMFFLLQLLEFIKHMFITYSGSNVYMENAAKDALKLVLLYGEHTSQQVRKVLWTTLEATVRNPCICPIGTNKLGRLVYGTPEYCSDLVNVAISNDVDGSMMAILDLYHFQENKERRLRRTKELFRRRRVPSSTRKLANNHFY